MSDYKLFSAAAEIAQVMEDIKRAKDRHLASVIALDLSKNALEYLSKLGYKVTTASVHGNSVVSRVYFNVEQE